VRPETKFGDTAIAVNPEDKRFEQFIGKELLLISATGPVKIRIIADNSISMDFGTGMMKVTPAHSTTDYEIYLRHNAAHPEFTIGYKNVIGKDSRLNSLAGEFAGLHAETDRAKIAGIMGSKGLVVYQEQSKSNITLCERTKTVIQPMMSSQWFIDTDKLKAPAIEAIQAGKVRIHPDYMTKKLEAWLEGLRDWPISRSIWWGYRIPVWYKGEVSEVTDQEGQLVVTIGGVGVKDMNEAVAKGLMKVELTEGFAPILIPGYRAPENASYYAQLKRSYPWAQIVHTGAKPQEYSDYKVAFDKINWSEESVAVAHSLGASAVIQYLLEQKLKIKHLILLAPSNKSAQRFEQYKRDGFWQAETGGVAGTIASKVSMIYSDDDEFYTQQQLEDFAAELAGGSSSVELILETGKKHFVTSDYNLGSAELEKLLAQEAITHEQSQAESLKELEAQGWVQDEDVFDTWFSSGQWPVATLESEGLLDHYPTSLMETGFDILELWVSRMLMLGIYSLGEVPFRDVYLHGLIKGEDGQKMSKSKGNLVYTEDVIAEYGADTLRMLYIVGNKAGASYRVDSRKLKGYRNFLNKIWNASRFILSNLEGASIDRSAHQQIADVFAEVELAGTADNSSESRDDNQIPSLETFKAVAKEEVRAALAAQNTHPLAQKLALEGADASMLIAMKEIEASVSLHLDNFRPGMAAEELIQHFWHVFADIYVEQVKNRLFQVDREGNPINRDETAQASRNKALTTLSYCGLSYLKLMHPFIPFISEKVWSYYPESLRESKSIMYSIWPGN
jgi:valyl-tRNA synthetase